YPCRLMCNGAAPEYAIGPLNGLELLERLLTVAAVAQRAARRRAEDVLERRVARAAVRAAEAVRLQLHECRPFRARGGRCKARRAQLLAALGRDAVGRPGVVEHDLDLRFRTELAQLVRHRVPHHLERRAAEERWR